MCCSSTESIANLAIEEILYPAMEDFQLDHDRRGTGRPARCASSCRLHPGRATTRSGLMTPAARALPYPAAPWCL
jgi:Holliday junction resolvasome RuvABC ATP-dependent DNA helicase subunit